MTGKLIIEHTDDGSKTLYLPGMDEHYHSVKGALTESQHIFIEMGLKARNLTDFAILEIGFGTGLNAFLSLLAAEQLQVNIRYTTLELYPLSHEIITSLHYSELVNSGDSGNFYSLHAAGWEKEQSLTPYFKIHKIKTDFTTFPLPADTFDVIYFDAFAPEKQPGMWQQSLFDKLYHTLRPGGILTTYCAKGVIRRRLQACGFTVERLPGPPGGKREILRATRQI